MPWHPLLEAESSEERNYAINFWLFSIQASSVYCTKSSTSTARTSIPEGLQVDGVIQLGTRRNNRSSATSFTDVGSFLCTVLTMR